VSPAAPGAVRRDGHRLRARRPGDRAPARRPSLDGRGGDQGQRADARGAPAARRPDQFIGNIEGGIHSGVAT
jgi:hypothetical protein